MGYLIISTNARRYQTHLRCHFYRASYASAVLGVSRNYVRLSVRLSVCPSVRHTLHSCFVTNPKKLPATFLHHMKGQSF